MRSLVLFIIAILSFSFVLSAAAEEDAAPLSLQDIDNIHTIGERLTALTYLAKQSFITAEQAAAAETQLLTEARIITGQALSVEELAIISRQPVPTVSLTALQRFAGLITFTNILWTLAIVLSVVCFCILFWRLMRFLLVIILTVPPEAYELLLAAAGIGLIVTAHWLAPGVREYIAFTGCLLFGGALAIAHTIHRRLERQEATLFLTLAIIAGISAVLYASSLSGFLAIVALMSALGFSAIAAPLCYCFGFRDDDLLGRATAVALVMVGVFVGLKMSATSIPELVPFQIGALYLGSFIGYLGLLIASSRWYAKKRHRYRYVLLQVATITAGLAALAIGSLWNITELRSIGGTFFILYLIEKFMEIPTHGITGFAAKGLFVSGVVYGICMLIKTYPEALRPYLLF